MLNLPKYLIFQLNRAEKIIWQKVSAYEAAVKSVGRRKPKIASVRKPKAEIPLLSFFYFSFFKIPKKIGGQNMSFRCAGRGGHPVAEKIYPVRVVEKTRRVEYKIIPQKAKGVSQTLI